MSTKEQVQFLVVLYTIPTALFAFTVTAIEFGPGAARGAAAAVSVAAESAAIAADHAATLAATGSYSQKVGVKRMVDTGSHVVAMTYGEFMGNRDRARRERANNSVPYPKYLERDFDSFPEVTDAD